MKTLFLVVLIACAAALTGAEHAAADITHDDLMAAIKDKSAVVIDVNGTDSFKEGHIPGALNWEDVKGDLAKHLPADKSALVVAYCGSEQCGAYKQAANAATKLGYTNVKHYSKGLSGFKASGAELETAAKKAEGKSSM